MFYTGKQSEGASDVVFEFLEQPNYNNEFLLKYEENQKPFIQLTDISFRYDDSDRLVLNDLNLEIFKGDQIALVGPAGQVNPLYTSYCRCLSANNRY